MAHGLGREEGVEDAALNLGGHSWAVVAHLEHGPPFVVGAQHDAHQVALDGPRGERLRRVDEQVDDDLAQVPFVAVDDRQGASVELDAGALVQLGAGNAQRDVDRAPQVDRHHPRLVDARERAQRVDDVANALGPLARLAHQRAKPLAIDGRRAKPFFDQLEVAGDVGEGVIDLVGDARRERAERREPFVQRQPRPRLVGLEQRLVFDAQGLFGRPHELAFEEIAAPHREKHELDPRPALVRGARRVHQDGHGLAFRPQQRDVDLVGPPLQRHQRHQVRVEEEARGERQQGVQRVADQAFARAAEQRRAGQIDVADDAIVVERKIAAGRLQQGGAQSAGTGGGSSRNARTCASTWLGWLTCGQCPEASSSA